MAKELVELNWIEELLPQDHVRFKRFGGFAYYVEEKMILFLIESLGNTTYRGQEFDFELWNGAMFPAEKEHHPEILRLYPFLRNHPILPKWLYVPTGGDDFENDVEMLLRELRRRNPLFGSIPKARSPKKKGRGRSEISAEEAETIDTRTPRMFSDEPAEDVLQKVQKISDFKNLGPESERVFLKAGIKTAAQFKKLGWKKTMVLLCESNPKNNHSIFAYAVIGALENKFWSRISDEAKQEAREFMKALREKAKPPRKKSASGTKPSPTKKPKAEPRQMKAPKSKTRGAKVREKRVVLTKKRQAKTLRAKATKVAASPHKKRKTASKTTLRRTAAKTKPRKI
jgi:hypothetical protein